MEVVLYFDNKYNLIETLDFLKQLCYIISPNIQDLYLYRNFIGKGSQARIDLYTERTTHAHHRANKYAVKTFFNHDNALKKETFLRMVYNEISFLRELQQCENIITLESVHRGETDFHLVLKFAEVGCLRTFLISQKSPGLQKNQIRFMMQQLLLATDFMHRRNIIHRDIKPQNILMTDKDVLMVCVADLGLAIKDYDIKCRTEQCGTPGYVDPEVLNG